MKLLLFLKEFLIVHVCVSVYKGKHDENTLNECVVLSNKFNKIYVTHRLHVKLQTVDAFFIIHTVCQNGKFGSNCLQSCGKCKGGSRCHHVNGSCFNGCSPGYNGTLCMDGMVLFIFFHL